MRARTGTAQLSLHGGKAPAWLFSRMVKLAREISIDKTVEVLRDAVTRAGLNRSERVQALKRLVRFGEERVRARMDGQPGPRAGG